MLLIAPLIILGLGSLMLLMVGAFTRHAAPTGILTLGTYALAAIPMVVIPFSGPVFPVAGGHLLQISPFTTMAGLILLGTAIMCLPLFNAFFTRQAHKAELYVLLTLSLTGMLTLAASANLLTLYAALELMSFPLYIMAAYMRDDAKSSEAGLKYFVLGSLASGLMLYGISLLYAATGTLNFNTLFTFLNTNPATPLILAGASLLLVGSLFKLSVVPFHMWTPDVYEGSPTPTTAIMGALPKVAAFTLLVRLLTGPLAGLQTLWQPALAWLALASMLVGSTLAIVQGNLKRLLAYSTIANVGFVMVGVVAANHEGHSGVLFYLAVYGLTTLGLFGTIISMGAEKVSDLRGLATRNPALAATMALFLFSLAGIPPLAGFMAKMMVFTAAVQAGFNVLAISGVLASAIALFYSLWLVKTMYFEQPATLQPTPQIPQTLQLMLMVAAIATLVLGIFPSLLSNLTLAAATAVF